jgi:DNA-binding winged helix-turn-helix (wHTH) protein/TolB-like protein/Tfp pilus assembly protein PilF
MQLKKGSFYEYGPFRLDPAEHRLTREGSPVSLAPKAFELLLVLVQNPGRLLTKQQIMEALWPGSFVEEANLTVSISLLRKALGEKEGNLRYIETVPKKGYRFIASVREVEGPDPSPPEEGHSRETQIAQTQPDGARSAGNPAELLAETGGQGRDDHRLISSGSAHSTGRHRFFPVLVVAILGLAIALAFYLIHRKPAIPYAHLTPVQRSLAILPLRNLRENPQDDFLGFSLADAVITRLGPVSSLTVRPSSAIEKYKGQTIDPQKVGADLSVDTLLTGTYIHDRDRLRITYQLIDVKTEKILGRDIIDLKYENLLTVQDAVTQQIIKGLSLDLSPSESTQMKAEEPANPLAYEYYLRGVDLMSNHDFPLAIEMLEKSAEINPNYGLTWAYLGQSYNSTASFQFGGRKQYQKARAAFERALALQPHQPEASIFLANLLIDTGEVEKAVPLLRDTLKNNPNNAAVHWELGYAYRFAGALKESVAECEQARRIDPSVKANGSVLNAYLYLNQYDKFLGSLPDPDDSSFLVFYRGLGEFHERKWTQASADFDRAYQIEHTMYTQTGKALSDSIVHRESDGLELLHDLENKIQQLGVGDPEGTYKIAEAYAVLGDKASALLMLRYSIDHGFFSYPYFVTDPLLDNIRSAPQFPLLMKIAQERHLAFKRQFLERP